MKVEPPEVSLLEVDVFTGMESEVIPPHTLRCLTCHVTESLERGSILLLKGTDPDWKVIEGCCGSSDGKILVMFANEGDQGWRIPPHSRVAVAREMKAEAELDLQMEEEALQVNIREIYIDPVEGSMVDNDDTTVQPDSEVKVEGRQEIRLPDGTLFPLPLGVNLEGMDSKQVHQIAKLLQENELAFSKGDLDLGYCDAIPHKINVTSNVPIRQPYRRIPPTQIAEVKKLLQDMLEKGIICKSSSPYASPIVLVRKKSGGLRLCIDYRQLNAVTIKDSFPLPRIEETLEVLGGAKYFSSLDLSHGYFQVAMVQESIEKTAFRVPWGLFEFKRNATRTL